MKGKEQKPTKVQRAALAAAVYVWRLGETREHAVERALQIADAIWEKA